MTWQAQTPLAGILVVAYLVFLFVVAALWVRTEHRHRTLEPLRRVGRVAFGLVLVVFAVPALVLMPLFWLDTVLPPEAGRESAARPDHGAGSLIALALVVVVNLVGSAVAVLQAVRGSRKGREPFLTVPAKSAERLTEPVSRAMPRGVIAAQWGVATTLPGQKLIGQIHP